MLKFINHSKDVIFKEMSQEIFEALFKSDEIYKRVAKFRETEDIEVKMGLPAILWNGYPDEEKYQQYLRDCEEQGKKPLSRRVQAGLRPTGLCMLDFDHMEDPKTLCRQIKQNVVKCGMKINEVIGLIHITPSGKGVRMVVVRQPGLTIAEEIDKWNKIIGCKHDESCKDLSRLSYVGTWDDIVFYNPSLLFKPIENFPDEPAILSNTKKKTPPKRKVKTACTTPSENVVKIADEEDRKYREYVKTIEEEFGGPPALGTRHNFIRKMAACLRWVFDFDAALMKQYIPDYGIETNEFNDLVEYMAENCHYEKMPYTMEKAIKKAEELIEELDQETEIEAYPENILPLFEYLEDGIMPSLPENLPLPIRLVVDTLPNRTKAYGALALFAAWGIYLKNVKFYHHFDEYVEHCFMVLAVGLSSTGKSDINNIKDFILEPIAEESKAAWARLTVYNKEKSKAKVENKFIDAPDDLVMQIAPTDMTSAGKLQLLLRNNPRRTFLYALELSALYKMTDGKKDLFWEEAKQCFDNTKVGAIRAGAESVQGEVELLINWIAHTTPGKLLADLKKTGSILDGALSRMSVAKLPLNNCTERLKDIRENKSAATQLRECTNKLTKVHDCKLRCEESEQWVKAQDERYRNYAEYADFPALNNFTPRAITLGFHRAIILWLMNDQKWTKEIEDFATWSVEYDLWGKVSMFGETIKKEHDKEIKAYNGEREEYSVLISMMPDTFTFDQFFEMRKKNAEDGTDFKLLKKQTSGLIRQWISRKKIVRVGNYSNKTFAKI